MTTRATADGDTPDPFEQSFTYFSGDGDYATVYLAELAAVTRRLSEQEAEIERLRSVASETEAHFRTVLFHHHSGKVEDDCAYNLRAVMALTPTTQDREG